MKKKNIIGFIVLSNIKNEKFWNLKGFCSNTVKQFYSSEDCISSLENYWFNDFADSDDRDIIIKTITTNDLEKMLADGVKVQS